MNKTGGYSGEPDLHHLLLNRSKVRISDVLGGFTAYPDGFGPGGETSAAADSRSQRDGSLH
jgi:hypothetical protein